MTSLPEYHHAPVILHLLFFHKVWAIARYLMWKIPKGNITLFDSYSMRIMAVFSFFCAWQHFTHVHFLHSLINMVVSYHRFYCKFIHFYWYSISPWSVLVPILISTFVKRFTKMLPTNALSLEICWSFPFQFYAKLSTGISLATQ